MDKEIDLRKEIEYLKKDIQSLEDIVRTILENLGEDPNTLKATNKIIKTFLEKSKLSKGNQKVVNEKIKKLDRGNIDEEKYDWVEDTIEFDTR